jgi:hypothetical protein
MAHVVTQGVNSFKFFMAYKVSSSVMEVIILKQVGSLPHGISASLDVHWTKKHTVLSSQNG